MLRRIGNHGKDNSSAGSTTSLRAGTEAGAGVFHSSQYGKMAWSLFLLVSSFSVGLVFSNV